MSVRFSRRLFLSTAASFFAAPLAMANPPAVSLAPRTRPQDLLRDPAISAQMIRNSALSGHVAYAVANPKSGEILESFQHDKTLPPASVAKVITAMYALEHLGPRHRFLTRVIARGKIQNGVLHGDLILAGGADPTLDTDDLALIASKLKATGLKEVRGDFLVWGGAVSYTREIDDSQPEHVGYNPALSGLSLNFNRVYFEWAKAGSGWGVSMDARSERYRPEVQVATMTVAIRDVPVYTYREKSGIDAWTVASGALGKKGARWLPVRQPDIYAGQVFRSFARSHGIVLKQEKPLRGRPTGTGLVTHRSAPLTQILRGMLKYSTNLTAELVGMAATKERTGKSLGLRASAKEQSRWAAQRFGMTKTKLVDHSGLGDASRVSALDLTRLLISAHQSQTLAPLLKNIPMRDAKGRTDKTHPVKVAAKTGTLNFVSSLAGFARRNNGKDLVFVIFTADQARRDALTEAQRERPKGARTWNKRSKRLQQALIERWSEIYGS